MTRSRPPGARTRASSRTPRAAALGAAALGAAGLGGDELPAGAAPTEPPDASLLSLRWSRLLRRAAVFGWSEWNEAALSSFVWSAAICAAALAASFSVTAVRK